MKKKLLLLVAACTSLSAFSQSTGNVGINTTEPKATLDIMASPQTATSIDGLLAPRLEGDELASKDALYTAEQTGAIVYVKSIPTNWTEKTNYLYHGGGVGYYYFDGYYWQKLAQSEPWVVENSDSKLATDSGQNIFHAGNVGIGWFDLNSINARLQVDNVPAGTNSGKPSITILATNTLNPGSYTGNPVGIQGLVKTDTGNVSFPNSNNVTGGRFQVINQSSGDTSKVTSFGVYSRNDVIGSASETKALGNTAIMAINTTGTIQSVVGYESQLSMISSTQPSVTGLRAFLDVRSGATVNNLYGFDILKVPGNSNGTINNFYGYHISPDATTGATNAWGLYFSANIPNYLSGNLGLGTKAPGAKLHIIKNSADLTPAIIEGIPSYSTESDGVNSSLPSGGLFKVGNALFVKP